MIYLLTPVNEGAKEANLGHLESAGQAISPQIRTNDTGILALTGRSGTIVEVLQPVLEDWEFRWAPISL